MLALLQFYSRIFLLYKPVGKAYVLNAFNQLFR